MRLLFGQNLSPVLVRRLQDCYPGSAHVLHLGLAEADDRDVWSYCRDERMLIVTKDADFGELAMLQGPPPKVVWLRLGNCTTTQIENLLRRHQHEVSVFDADDDAAVLTLL